MHRMRRVSQVIASMREASLIHCRSVLTDGDSALICKRRQGDLVYVSSRTHMLSVIRRSQLYRLWCYFVSSLARSPMHSGEPSAKLLSDAGSDGPLPGPGAVASASTTACAATGDRHCNRIGVRTSHICLCYVSFLCFLMCENV